VAERESKAFSSSAGWQNFPEISGRARRSVGGFRKRWRRVGGGGAAAEWVGGWVGRRLSVCMGNEK